MSALPGPGDLFGAYRIERLLGRGAMGAVYAATQAPLNRQVALKVLLPVLAEDQDYRLRFAREAEAMARLDSPHIIQVYEHGDHDGCLFIAAQFVNGEDLHALIQRQGPLPVATACTIAAQVASALAEAHDAGVLHRDVKPNNVMVRLIQGRPHAYLCDFGIAVAGEERITSTGAVAGTWAYLAPERCEGQDATASSDLYALGCVLWKMLTGLAPYAGTAVHLAMQHVNAPVPQAEPRDPVSLAINGFLLRAMAKRPAERYADAAAVQSELERIAALAGSVGVTSIVPRAAVEGAAQGSPEQVTHGGASSQGGHAGERSPGTPEGTDALPTVGPGGWSGGGPGGWSGGGSGGPGGPSGPGPGGPAWPQPQPQPYPHPQPHPRPQPGPVRPTDDSRRRRRRKILAAVLATVLLVAALGGAAWLVLRDGAGLGSALGGPDLWQPGQVSHQVLSGDFTGDGVSDVAALVGEDGDTARIDLLRGAEDALEGPVELVGDLDLGPDSPIGAGNVTADSVADLVLVHEPDDGRRAVELGVVTRNGVSTAQVGWLETGGPVRLAVGDVADRDLPEGQDDKTLDAVALVEGDDGAELMVLASDGGTLGEPQSWYGGLDWDVATTQIRVVDVNDDEWADLVAVPDPTADDAEVLVLLSDGGRFGEPLTWGSAPGGEGSQLVAADFTGDRVGDLASVHGDEGPDGGATVAVGAGEYGDEQDPAVAEPASWSDEVADELAGLGPLSDLVAARTKFGRDADADLVLLHPASEEDGGVAVSVLEAEDGAFVRLVSMVTVPNWSWTAGS